MKKATLQFEVPIDFAKGIAENVQYLILEKVMEIMFMNVH